MFEEIAKLFGAILNGNFAAPFIIILLIGFIRVATLLLKEKDQRFSDSQIYSKNITDLNESLTKLEMANQESNKLLITKIDGFISGKQA